MIQLVIHIHRSFSISLVLFSEQVEATRVSVVSRADFNGQKFPVAALWELHDKKGEWAQGNRREAIACVCGGAEKT